MELLQIEFYKRYRRNANIGVLGGEKSGVPPKIKRGVVSG